MPKKAVDLDNQPKRPLRIIGRLLLLAKGHYGKTIITILLLLTNSLLVVADSLYLRFLLDKFLIAPEVADLAKNIAILGLIFLLANLALLLSVYIYLPVAAAILKNLRQRLFAHSQTLPIKFFSEQKTGELLSHYTNDMDLLASFINYSLPNVFSSLVMMFLVLIAMFYLSWPLALMFIAGLLLIFFISRFLLERSHQSYCSLGKSLAKVNGYAQEMIMGQKVIKIFTREKEIQTQFKQNTKQLFTHAFKAQKWGGLIFPLMMYAGNLQYLLIALVGGLMIYYGWGAISIGSLIGFLRLSRDLSIHFNRFAGQINALMRALAGGGRIFSLLDEQSESDTGTIELIATKKNHQAPFGLLWHDSQAESTKSDRPLLGKVEFAGVDFAYEGKKVLQGLNFKITPGKKFAFVGATGAGKTTITYLLNQFYQPTAGEIYYDGLPLSQIKKSASRRSIAMVFQDTHLFAGSIAENILYGNPEASLAEVKRLSKLVGADSFIRNLPKGYQTRFASNLDLSAGQKQLIAIVRALIANPPVLILDEATASLDTRLEQLVQQGLEQLMKGRTVLIIAHRLSTIRNADTIVVLEKGKIVEQGSHRQLITKKGHYWQLTQGLKELE